MAGQSGAFGQGDRQFGAAARIVQGRGAGAESLRLGRAPRRPRLGGVDFDGLDVTPGGVVRVRPGDPADLARLLAP